MRCYLGENYIPFSIPTENRSTSVKVTSDITEVARTVQILLYITHGDDVIGKTNRVELKVFATKAGTPLAPREEFDEIIRQQRATIAEQQSTISNQLQQIETDSDTINSLNTQVETLSSQNLQLENQHNIDLASIQTLTERAPRQADLQKFLARDIDFELEIEADTIGDYLCYKQTGMTDCRLTGSPTSIGNYAFNGCSALQSINLPNSLIRIQNSAFNGCSALQSIDLPNSLTTIEKNAFDGCVSLQMIKIPGQVQTIGIQAFQRCSAVREIELEHGVKEVGMQSFRDLPNLTIIKLPNTLTVFHVWALQSSSYFTTVVLENGFNCSIDFSASSMLSAETLVAMLQALKDLTGETAKTLTVGSTNLAKLTAEQIAIATNKNWNLA